MKELDIKLHEEWLKDIYFDKRVKRAIRTVSKCLMGPCEKKNFSKTEKTREVLQEGTCQTKKFLNNYNMSNY